MRSTMITTTKINAKNLAQSANEIALLLEQMEVYGMVKRYADKQEEPAANVTATEMATFEDWMNHRGVARSTIPLGMEPRISADYTIIHDAKMLWEKLTSGSKSKLKLNICEIREDIWSSKQHDCGDVDNSALRIDRTDKNYNLCAGPSTTGADVNTAK